LRRGFGRINPFPVIREIVNAALKALSGKFAKLYPPIGRGSIPPERLMRAWLLQAFHSIRSERQLHRRISDVGSHRGQ
jgi:Transposase domain (DUF772)